jgi:hypothetical protein
METKEFNVGDKVRGTSADIRGCEGIITADNGNGYAIKLTKVCDKSWHGKDGWQVGDTLVRGTYWTGCLELIAKGQTAISKPPRFVLQYRLDESRTEYFVTLPEAKAHIKELANNSSLKRDKIFLHTLAKTQKVELGTSINIKRA